MMCYKSEFNVMRDRGSVREGTHGRAICMLESLPLLNFIILVQRSARCRESGAKIVFRPIKPKIRVT